ncbi:MAG TPA: hypothetical protein PK874_06345 [Desulfobacteraceae bacterium]|nr:hypothetical protein [Desulfobacteraceae bacterium]HPJ66648.1 hypothetical protein [Desulfobacteraceae bacterium]HPQ27767.1 hypothetical protein [Desulfobacteraceae bacterium]
MKFLDKDLKKLEDGLKEAYARKEDIEVELDSKWETGVMRDIRRLGPVNGGSAFLFLSKFVWRFSTVACSVAVLLLIYAGFIGIDPIEQIADMYFSAPVELSVAHLIGE